MKNRNYILGAGVTGLAAGMASGLPVLEATDHPGGICSSYYLREGETRRRLKLPQEDDAYRFELGGGHWIFGADPLTLNLIQSLSPVKQYQRKASVYFADKKIYAAYPLQQHLDCLGSKIARKASRELASAVPCGTTMSEWLRSSFGATLFDLFFGPFHESYTAGLYQRIAPQDSYKSPQQPKRIQTSREKKRGAGYNVTFIYPERGLDHLTEQIAARCDVRYGQKIETINLRDQRLLLQSGKKLKYGRLISTLPLLHTLQMCSLKTKHTADPYTSVLVLNIGGEIGTNCPHDHWVYIPESKAGFHRVGIYSNVDTAFLPKKNRKHRSAVSFYVERAFKGGEKPTKKQIEEYSKAVIQELQSWGYLKSCSVLDSTWIEVAYTWTWPDSNWRQEAIALLEKNNIYPVGRYARWRFQGIAESIRDGLTAGAAFKFL